MLRNWCAQVFLLPCAAISVLGLAGCAGLHITGVNPYGDALRFQVEGRSGWLTEEELPSNIDSAQFDSLQKVGTSIRNAWLAAQNRSREQWLQESTTEAAADMRRKLPAGFTLEIEGKFLVACEGDDAQRKGLKQMLDAMGEKCAGIRGHGRPLSMGPVRIYYASTEQKYVEAYQSVFGKPPSGVLGICSPEPPPRLFGLASVGDGSLAHEWVHVLMMADWPAMPGWLNESLAVAIGCPQVGVRSGKGPTISDYHLYVAINALKQGKSMMLDQAFKTRGQDYADLDHIPVELPAINAQTVVGPLATGRMFVRWLEEQGSLPSFYQSYRDSGDPGRALRTAFPDVTVSEVESRFASWISGHDESALLSKPAKSE